MSVPIIIDLLDKERMTMHEKSVYNMPTNHTTFLNIFVSNENEL